ncbi:lipid-binding protein [Thalassobellus suaedae]|uniref:Lipid-binding protein n=1 Tax=Thalassobellus suaedae TaxID=3074124 RepID=A0ABY9XQ87_9FLAO|nr:lipid-binding protein [Flavobacteriaceae bacterium HL-DH14]
MKKNIIYLWLFIFAFTLNSCDEDIEIWDSNTLDYSGTYFWQLYDETNTDLYIDYDHAIQLLIYNTSDNKENEVWIEDTDHVFPLKSKFLFDGTATSFKSQTLEFDNLFNNELAIENPNTKPTGLNQEVTEDRDYIRSAILDGKILPKAGTTVSGNPVDSLYIKIVLYSGSVKFTSKAVPVELRADPEVEEFDWEYDSATYDNTLDETYVVSGHRKTGFAEDDH